MKSIEVIVPINLVIKCYHHPEAYGEYIVELINGMWTDVYINERKNLFTITNDDKLIAYLKNHQKKL